MSSKRKRNRSFGNVTPVKRRKRRTWFADREGEAHTMPGSTTLSYLRLDDASWKDMWERIEKTLGVGNLNELPSDYRIWATKPEKNDHRWHLIWSNADDDESSETEATTEQTDALEAAHA